ncbi:MAG: acyltransferase domain-containing protein [Oscillospiraceae bacterium]
MALAAARENGIDNCAAAGHSLGEYAAMYASGMLGMEDAFKAIKLRAAAMAEAAEATGGSMAAIIGSDNETIAKVCEEVNGFALQLTTTARSRPSSQANQQLSTRLWQSSPRWASAQ